MPPAPQQKSARCNKPVPPGHERRTSNQEEDNMKPLAVYDRGIDYSGLRPNPFSDPAKSGAKFVIRYSAGAGNNRRDTQWKLCGKDELRHLVAAGYDVIANSEWSASRVTEGAAAGTADGAADLAFWKARGLAKGASIYVSWDEG